MGFLSEQDAAILLPYRRNQTTSSSPPKPPEKLDVSEIVRRCFREPTADEAKRDAIERFKAECKQKGERLIKFGPSLGDKDVQRIVTGTFEPTDASKVVLEWTSAISSSRAAKRFLVLSGGVGCGKTFAAAIAMSQLGGYAVRSGRLHIVVDPWKDERRPNEFRVNPRYDGLLVLDDLGEETDYAGRWSDAFFDFVDSRQSGRRYSIITTNLPAKAFKERYDARVVDRLNASTQFVAIQGPTMRGKK